jgi:hypothetical protein
MRPCFLDIGVLACGLVLACDSPTDPPDPGGASYSADLEPNLLVASVGPCDRYISYAILSLGSRRDRGFDLSINLYDDCSATGGGYDFWEVLILGHYSVTGDQLTFIPDVQQTPDFGGSYEADFVTVTLPVRADSLAILPVTLELGPRSPF